MKKSIALLVALAVSGCSLIDRNKNPYEKPPVYTRFIDENSPLDRQLQATYDAVRANLNSAPLHNDLGQLLLRKGFPKDAEREFERAVDADGRFYPAWYNLGLVRAGLDDYSGAKRAFYRTTRIMKGHSEALFQLGLIEEKNGARDSAIAYYAKALRHNPRIIDVRVNPLVLDSKLIHLAILRNYDRDHMRHTGVLLGTPPNYVAPPMEAPSPQAQAKDIVTPSAPITDPATQTPPPKP